MHSVARLEAGIANGLIEQHGLAAADAARGARNVRQLMQAFDTEIANRDRHRYNGIHAATGPILIDHGKLASYKRAYPPYNSPYAHSPDAEIVRDLGRKQLLQVRLSDDVVDHLRTADRDRIAAALEDAVRAARGHDDLGDNAVRPSMDWLPRIDGVLDDIDRHGTVRYVAARRT